ncbi:MAG: OadG family protein [Pyramidobacter sp.]|jgi:sodium pump decarboxylase gamma subunit
MAATETANSLAASFDGMGGATALSLIAFSVVFLVLIGLTLVIFAMRYVTKLKKTPKTELPSSAAAPAPSAATAAPATEDDELVAVIAAAIAAQTGSLMSIKSIVPAGEHLIGAGTDGWIACARIEALQSSLTDGWN